MLLADRTFVSLPPAQTGIALAAGLVQLGTVAITVLPAGGLPRNSRLTLLDAIAIATPAALGTVAIEGAAAVLASYQIAAAFGQVTALLDNTPLRIATPFVMDVEELLQAGTDWSNATISFFWTLILNNTGAATTLSVSAQNLRWRWQLSDAKGFG